MTAGTDRLRGNNLLRGLIADHYTQNVAGRRAEPVVYASVHGTVGFHDSAESVVTSVAEAIARRDLAVDYVQVDAGWYRLLADKLGTDAWAWSCGNWTPDPARYPNGMRAAADAAHGLKYILWFEPERAMVGTETHREHPEFLIPPPPAYALPPEHRYMSDDGFRLLDLGNPVTFYRSDLTWVPEPQQSMTAALSYWVPFHGVGAISRTPYDVRSGMGAVFGLAINVRELTSSAIKRQIAELRDLGDLFLGDCYPLTGYSRQDDLWVAWQFDRPDQGGGLVQAFRRSRAEQQTLELRLRNLNPMLSSVDNRQVRRLFDGKLQEYPVLVEGRDTNAILREYMRTEDRSAEGTGALRALHDYIDGGRREEAEELYKKLLSRWGDLDPDLIEAKVLLDLEE